MGLTLMLPSERKGSELIRLLDTAANEVGLAHSGLREKLGDGVSNPYIDKDDERYTRYFGRKGNVSGLQAFPRVIKVTLCSGQNYNSVYLEPYEINRGDLSKFVGAFYNLVNCDL